MADQDWYAFLGVSADASTDDISRIVEKRGRQAAALANTNPERSHQLREQVRAIKRDLLSGEDARAQYDATLVKPRPRPTPAGPTPANTAVASEPVPPQEPNVAPQTSSQEQPSAPASPGYPQQEAGGRSRGRLLRFLQTGYTCWNCAESTLPGDKFCTQCCAQLGPDSSYVPVTTPVTNPNACVYCGTIAATTHRFCRKCGAGRPA